MSDPSTSIPDFHPTDTESVQSIPSRFLLKGFLSRTAKGDWKYEGGDVEHKGVQRFLSHQLQRTAEGEYWVVNGPQRVFVKLEGAPFQITALDEQEQQLHALLDDGTSEVLRFETLYIDDEEYLYTKVKYGKAGDSSEQGHLARLSRQAVYILAEYLETDEGNGTFFVHWQEKRIPILPLPS